MIHVLIVDDHAFLRESLELQLANAELPMMIETAADAVTAVEMIRSKKTFHLVLLDLALPDMDGFTCLGKLKKARPDCPVAILSAYDDNATICRAKAGGASGFLSKRMSASELLQAVAQIAEGQEFWVLPYPSQPLAPQAPENHPLRVTGKGVKATDYGLTDRQQELLSLLGQGLSNREIAEQLDISEGTVKSHLHTIFKALGVSSRAQALALIGRFKIR